MLKIDQPKYQQNIRNNSVHNVKHLRNMQQEATF